LQLKSVTPVLGGVHPGRVDPDEHPRHRFFVISTYCTVCIVPYHEAVRTLARCIQIGVPIANGAGWFNLQGVWTNIGPSLSNCINGALTSKAPFETALAIYFARISDGDKKKIFNTLSDPSFFMSTACSGSGTAEVFPILLWRCREVGLKSAHLLLLDFSFWMYCTACGGIRSPLH
jgi:hypothetical protein